MIKIKTISERLDEMLFEAGLPDEGETFKTTKAITGVDEVDKNFKVQDKNAEIPAGMELEVQSASNVVVYVKCIKSGKFYGFAAVEWKKLPLKML